MEHEAGKGDEVQASDGLWQAFVVAREAAEAGCPGEAAFHDPASGQEHEAASVCLTTSRRMACSWAASAGSWPV